MNESNQLILERYLLVFKINVSMEKIAENLMIVLMILIVMAVGYFVFRFSVDNYNQNLNGSYKITVPTEKSN